MKKIGTLLSSILLIAVLILTGCSSKESGDAKSSGSKGSDTFTIGMEAGYPPFNWTQGDDSNGAVAIQGNAEYAGGYDVQIAKKIADGLGKKLVISKMEWDGLVPALASGKIDAIIAGMSPTEERKKTIDFSDNYYTSHLVMVVKKGSKYENATSIEDFKGARVTAQLNTFHYTVIDQIPGVKKQTATDNFSAMRVALQAGKMDAYVSEKPEAVSATSANDQFKMVEFSEGKGFKTAAEDTQTAVGIPKDSKLTKKINEILKGISEEERTKMMDDAIKQQPAAK